MNLVKKTVNGKTVYRNPNYDNMINNDEIETSENIYHPTKEDDLLVLRSRRDMLLKETDWVAGDDVPQVLKDKFYVYRQALRDITNDFTSLNDVVWPIKP